MTETKISSFSVEVNLIDLESDNSGNSLLDAYILAPEGLAMETSEVEPEQVLAIVLFV